MPGRLLQSVAAAAADGRLDGRSASTRIAEACDSSCLPVCRNGLAHRHDARMLTCANVGIELGECASSSTIAIAP